ncbi:hypothetical protein [Chlamydia sp.]|uniref:hypothetical protein n=1 Tax=Chlamydia sp. TaxID=35827 RepID=UPI0025C2B6A6|nr:hypothetical protein [Chlamydia sp.]
MQSKKTIKWLKQALVLSSFVNVLLLLLIYSTVFRKDMYKLHVFPGNLIAKSSRIGKIPEDILDRLEKASLLDLLALLNEEQLVFGHPLKLWALGLGIQKYCIDITPMLTRPLTFIKLKSPEHIWLLPDIDDQEFSRIHRYLHTERFPFSSQGFFRILVRDWENGVINEDILYRFCHLPEFLYVRSLLFGAEMKASSVASLARMVIQGGEELFFSLCRLENRKTAISDCQRRVFLKAYVDRQEPLAALLLLVHDADWVLHEFSDSELKRFVQLLPKEAHDAEKFLVRVENSCRQGVLERY